MEIFINIRFVCIIICKHKKLNFFKPVFLSKQERAAEALRRRQEEVEEVRRRQEEERKKRIEFSKSAQTAAPNDKSERDRHEDFRRERDIDREKESFRSVIGYKNDFLLPI